MKRSFAAAAVVTLIVLHNIDGDEVTINIDQIVTLNFTKEGNQTGANQLISGGNKCVIGLTNGKFASVVEPCGMVRQAIIAAQKL